MEFHTGFIPLDDRQAQVDKVLQSVQNHIDAHGLENVGVISVVVAGFNPGEIDAEFLGKPSIALYALSATLLEIMMDLPEDERGSVDWSFRKLVEFWASKLDESNVSGR